MKSLEEARAAIAACDALVARGDYREALACLGAAEPVLVSILGEAHEDVVNLRLDRATIQVMAGMHAFGRSMYEALGVRSSTDVWDGPQEPRPPRASS